MTYQAMRKEARKMQKSGKTPTQIAEAMNAKGYKNTDGNDIHPTLVYYWFASDRKNRSNGKRRRMNPKVGRATNKVRGKNKDGQLLQTIRDVQKIKMNDGDKLALIELISELK